MKISEEHITQAKQIISAMLEAMGFVEYTIYEDQLESRQILSIAAENQAVLIGRKGESLTAFQTLFNVILKHQDPTAPFITIDIAGYKKERIEKVMRIAEDTAKKVRDYGREQEMKPMNAFERRIVHTVLAEIPELETESVGEDPNRKVIIRLKQS
ncbi:KH domain-containing protein [bacterium]|jgi:spoIIIJ-associated protein|nr:MAG: KH domain-containing protein [bacterium]